MQTDSQIQTNQIQRAHIPHVMLIFSESNYFPENNTRPCSKMSQANNKQDKSNTLRAQNQYK